MDSLNRHFSCHTSSWKTINSSRDRLHWQSPSTKWNLAGTFADFFLHICWIIKYESVSWYCNNQCLNIKIRFDNSVVQYYIKIWDHSCNCDRNKGGSQVLFVTKQQSLCREEVQVDGWVKNLNRITSFPVSNHESTLFFKTITTIVPQSRSYYQYPDNQGSLTLRKYQFKTHSQCLIYFFLLKWFISWLAPVYYCKNQKNYFSPGTEQGLMKKMSATIPCFCFSHKLMSYNSRSLPPSKMRSWL